MFAYDGFLYRSMSRLTNFITLSLLYLASSLLIVTIFPATAALFGVARKWVLNEEPPIFRTYFSLFRENAKQSLLIGLFCLLFALVISADFYALHVVKSTGHWMFSGALWGLVVLGVITLLSMFPLMVHTYSPTKALIVNSFKIALYRPHLTLINALVLYAITVIGTRIPLVFILLFPASAAYVTFWCANRKFIHVFQAKDNQVQNNQVQNNQVQNNEGAAAASHVDHTQTDPQIQN